MRFIWILMVNCFGTPHIPNNTGLISFGSFPPSQVAILVDHGCFDCFNPSWTWIHHSFSRMLRRPRNHSLVWRLSALFKCNNIRPTPKQVLFCFTFMVTSKLFWEVTGSYVMRFLSFIVYRRMQLSLVTCFKDLVPLPENGCIVRAFISFLFSNPLTAVKPFHRSWNKSLPDYY